MPGGVRLFSEHLAQLARDGADADHIAALAVAKWRSIDNALAPIIGHGGVTALFNRSVSLRRPAHAWLGSPHDGLDQPHNLAALQSSLCQRPSAEAAAAAGAVLDEFVDLLSHLIGAALTERLLKSVWDNIPSDGAGQDTSR